MQRKILRLAGVTEATGKPRSSIYEDMKEGTFPRPVKLGNHGSRGAVGWFEDEIAEWLAARAAERDARAHLRDRHDRPAQKRQPRATSAAGKADR
jgi:prophage regulatory protein